MAATITIPDFQYSSHYYPELLEDLTTYMRNNCPELTDEDPTEPHIQLIRAYSLAGHLNNVLLDLVANEMFLPTAKLRASVVNLLKLIGVKLAQASPANTDLLVKLTKTFGAVQVTVPSSSLFATLETRAARAVLFEVLEDISTVVRTDQVEKVYSYNGTTYTDNSAEAQSPTGHFTPTWAGASGDALYIGHEGVLWDKLRINLNAGGSGFVGVWEYYDGNYDQDVPSTATNLGSTLQFHLNGLLGSADRTGTIVRVRSALTGAFQDLTVSYVGGNNLITTGGVDPFLSQTSPSTNVDDYIVGSAWQPLPGLTDGSVGLTTPGVCDIAYTLPQNVLQDWRPFSVGAGVLAITAYWLRFRVISVSAPTSPQITEVRIQDGNQYQVFSVTQGQSRNDDPLGSSDGTPDQTFTLTNFPVVDDTNLVVTVSESSVDKVYTRVDNFLNSLPTDRDYTVSFDDQGGATIQFGDGNNGKIPPAGVNNIKVAYRTMDDLNGNVGFNTITVNRSGVAFLAALSNPRAAAGWAEAEGSDDVDLARVKIAGPASLRTGGRAVAPGDAETVALKFTATDGSTPVKRALAIEESFGVKTVELVVVGAGGVQVDAAKLAQISDYFNGTEDVRGVMLFNYQLTPTNFVPHIINIDVTVKGGNATAIITALTALLNPLAVDSDGLFTWSFGGQVTLARLIQEIMNTGNGITNAVLATPSADVSLATRELPTIGTINVTVT